MDIRVAADRVLPHPKFRTTVPEDIQVCKGSGRTCREALGFLVIWRLALSSENNSKNLNLLQSKVLAASA